MMLDVGHEQLESLGSSPAMRELRASIVAVTLEGRDIVLCGEPGTGRRWVARAIHGMGGHEPSSWIETDARQIAPSDIDALVRAARCGTLVLRELAAAQDGVRAAIDAAARARPYGAATRLVATVGDLAAASGSLGEGAVFLRLPPLRERAREDLTAVLDSVHRTLRADMGVTPSLLDAAARERLLEQRWSGNIREMRNALERALIAAGDAPTVGVEHLPIELRSDPVDDGVSPTATLAEVERAHIERTVRRHAGNRTRAARELGISRATLINKIRVYALDV